MEKLKENDPVIEKATGIEWRVVYVKICGLVWCKRNGSDGSVLKRIHKRDLRIPGENDVRTQQG